MPCPVRVTFCGLPPPSSNTFRVPFRNPFAVGLNLTPNVQFAPGKIEVPHVLVSKKSFAFVPMILTEEIVTGTLPTFLSVTCLALLVVPTFRAEKDSCEGVKLTEVPIPLSEMTCGLVGVLWVMVRLPVVGPAAVGVNVT